MTWHTGDSILQVYRLVAMSCQSLSAQGCLSFSPTPQPTRRPNPSTRLPSSAYFSSWRPQRPPETPESFRISGRCGVPNHLASSQRTIYVWKERVPVWGLWVGAVPQWAGRQAASAFLSMAGGLCPEFRRKVLETCLYIALCRKSARLFTYQRTLPRCFILMRTLNNLILNKPLN